MSQDSTPAGTQIKLLVNTASEAVNVIREKYGEQARVLSVKQVEAGGLKRLVSKPRLEVIVEILGPGPQSKAKAPAANPPAQAAAATPKPNIQKEDTPSPKAAASASEQKQAPLNKTPIGDLYSKSNSEDDDAGSYFSQFEDDAPAKTKVPAVDSEEQEAPLGSAANPVKRGTLEAVQRAISMLESVGFDRSLIERIRSEVDFRDIGSLPTMDLYAKICDWLRSRFPHTSKPELGPRRAFIGCSGVGKTSALCKMLSADVFVNGLAPTVLKVDSELPNPSDSLEVFCEIMGVGLARSAEEVGETDQSRPLLVDMPGYSLSDGKSVQACRETLDSLGIDERIVVVNAAYEAELIADMLATGESIGATKVIFTHLEETRRAGKLWKFLLNRRMEPLFFSEGPNPAGEYTMETYSYLLERSFPNGRQLAAAAKRGKPVGATQSGEERYSS
ncbi:hypothetical protein IEN85_04105 [Pelagicoccus sp. NFK12]|uniref:SRP54-type proteins GTP-binding domain-containing protein n=1 Tax=Pelagicoccus enzymogenes TaxID=2773457 RepID=A0A927F6N0_9BACT|nr:hypothetical protein [Pelagicoccus enzymogenes]MBD5778661.1 hypothetical protein [Pelagicoccus enzymogenes]